MLKDLGILQCDLGPFEIAPQDDYPLYAFMLAEKVAANPNDRGILVCGTGAGMCIAANKVKGIRAAEAESVAEAQAIRNDDDANILILSQLNYEPNLYKQIIDTWYHTPFSNAERHLRRLKQIADYENGNTPSPTSQEI
jgi:ribose 5-phosphate isomerase B